MVDSGGRSAHCRIDSERTRPGNTQRSNPSLSIHRKEIVFGPVVHTEAPDQDGGSCKSHAGSPKDDVWQQVGVISDCVAVIWDASLLRAR